MSNERRPITRYQATEYVCKAVEEKVFGVLSRSLWAYYPSLYSPRLTMEDIDVLEATFTATLADLRAAVERGKEMKEYVPPEGRPLTPAPFYNQGDDAPPGWGPY